MSTTLSAPPRRRVADLGLRARRDRAVRTASGSALWLSLLLVTYWWVADRGLQDLFQPLTSMTSLGRISGLVASVLLLAQVVLMARVPVIEQAFGQDVLTKMHRTVGFTSFNLMLVHILTITLGYAGNSVSASPRTLWNLTVSYPGMLLALGGTACLVMVVVTSVKASRAKLRYESWHLMHLYAYLGVGLALPHQLWTGQQFVTSPAKTAFWWTAWAVSVAAVLVWRVGRPVLLNLRHQLKVVGVIDEGDGVRSVHITGRRLDALNVEAGQFFNWRFLTGPGWSRGNPYSISAAPNGRSLRFTVQDVGDGSRLTARLRPGTRVLVEGPYGRLTARPRTRRKVAFIGAGVGITPLRALAEGLPYSAGDAVYLERYTDEPLFGRELEALAAGRGLRVLRLRGRRRAPDSWLGDGVGEADDLTALRYWVPDIADRDVYVCGPDAWTELVRSTLDAAGLPEEQLHLETFAW